MLILNDTTDRVLRIKHLQELDNYKDNLLATVSHDLKTPLNGLSIIANVVKNSIENKEKIKKNEILGKINVIVEIIRHMDDMLSNQ
jgi:K+-sensing histidine kinase KdpD